MGLPAVPWGSPSSLIPMEAVLPGGPATKAQQLWVASGNSSRIRATNAWAASEVGACPPVVMKRLLWITSSTRCNRDGIGYRRCGSVKGSLSPVGPRDALQGSLNNHLPDTFESQRFNDLFSPVEADSHWLRLSVGMLRRALLGAAAG